MHVARAEVSDCWFSTDGAHCSGVVRFHTDAGEVFIHCSTVAAHETPHLQNRLLIKDALRQLERMPEIRSGYEDLVISEAVLGAEIANA